MLLCQILRAHSRVNFVMIVGLAMLLSNGSNWCALGGEIHNLNFQLPLRAGEPIRLHLLEYSTKTNRIIGYFHIANDYSYLQRNNQAIDHHPIPIIFATYQQQQTQFSKATMLPLQEKSVKFPLQPTSITCESHSDSRESLGYDAGLLAFKPKRYRFELGPFDKKHLLVGKRIEIDLVVRLSTSGVCASDDNNYDFPYKFNLILDTNENSIGMGKVEEINFVNGYFYSKEKIRLHSLAHISSKDDQPERIEGFIAVRNLSYSKKIVLHIKIGHLNCPEQELEAFWVYSASEQVDMFRFSHEFNHWDSGFERTFTIKSIEYFWDGGHDVDRNNNEVGY